MCHPGKEIGERKITACNLYFYGALRERDLFPGADRIFKTRFTIQSLCVTIDTTLGKGNFSKEQTTLALILSPFRREGGKVILESKDRSCPKIKPGNKRETLVYNTSTKI